MHTYPVSRCAKATVRENLEFYKSLNYTGVFITNHFLDGCINIDSELPYREQLDFMFSDYENALTIGKELGIDVFYGIETSFVTPHTSRTDILVYGLDKQWWYDNPQIMELPKRSQIKLFKENGALTIQAHPFKPLPDYIKLFTNCHGAEIINCKQKDEYNQLAKNYTEVFGLIEFAGSDNHSGSNQEKLSGLLFEEKITDEADFVKKVLNRQFTIFSESVAQSGGGYTCD